MPEVAKTHGWPSSTVGEVTREVLMRGPVLRAEVAERLGLSMPSMTRLLRPLMASGLIVESTASVTGALGRPATPVDVRADAASFLGFKLTGDMAFAVLTDLRANATRAAERPLVSQTLDGVLETLGELASELTGSRPVQSIGISLGARVSAGGVVDRAPFLGWSDVPLQASAEAAFGVPVVVANDLVALTLAEHWFGLGRGLDSFAVLTVGAGVGYGLVLHDRVVVSPDTDLGLGGHIPLDPLGPPCFLGHRGCSTAMLTIPSIEAQASIGLRRGVSYNEILERAAEGDPVSSDVLDAAAAALGRYVALVANIAMVDHIVLAGEGIGLLERRLDLVRDTARRDRDPAAREVDLRVDHSGFTAWARGAAAVAIQSAVNAMAAGALRF